MIRRAYSVLEVKEVSEDKRVITGIATTPTPDRMGDVIEPLGIEYKNPLPLLWQHRSAEPVGTVEFNKPTKEGIKFVARIAMLEEAGRLKDRLDEAWQSVKLGLVRAVSIGFRDIEYSVMDTGLHFLKTEVLELSLVTIPANQDATIQTVRSIDTEQRAAFGVRDGASARKATQPLKEGKMTILEQIAAYEASRQAKAARLDELMNKAAEEGVVLDETQSQEYEELDAEVKAIDVHLTRLRATEARQRQTAAPIDGGSSRAGAASRAPAMANAVLMRQLPKGISFTRYACSLAMAKGNVMHAAEIAKRWQDTPEVERVLRAAVVAGTTTDADWAAPLVDYQVMASEFIELLRPMTFLGRLAGLRRVPFMVKIPGQTAGSTVGWVGETKPKPVSELAFNMTQLTHATIAGIVVLSEQLVRLSNPSAEALVQRDLTETVAQFMDQQFLDPSVAEVANVSPASILNGVTPVPASGTTADALKADANAIFTNFINAGLSAAGAVWLMSERLALALSTMQNVLSQPEFPGLTATGGTFLGGLPAITSENVPTNLVDAGASPDYQAGDILALVKPSEILFADEGGVNIDVSREASLQMDSAPTDPTVADTVMVSLWQRNMVGVRVERMVNWKKRRAAAAQYIIGANYGGA
jgi:HK97 family phage major capsid protein/HK97 family phage prohead protease